MNCVYLTKYGLTIIFLIINILTGCQSEIKFYCNFDGLLANSICGGIIVTNAGANNFVTQVQSEAINGTDPQVSITDVSSILKPTKNQKRTCQIPFEMDGVNNYFCVLNRNTQNILLSTYECDTRDGIFDECDRGYFTRFRPTPITDIFNAGFTWINLIDLKAPGQYEISFYTFIYCPKLDCDTDDTIILKVKDEDSELREIYRSGVTTGRVRDNGWVRDTVVFKARTAKINIRFEFVRTTQINGVITAFGVDEITISDRYISTAALDSTTPLISTTRGFLTESINSEIITKSSLFPSDTKTTDIFIISPTVINTETDSLFVTEPVLTSTRTSNENEFSEVTDFITTNLIFEKTTTDNIDLSSHDKPTETSTKSIESSIFITTPMLSLSTISLVATILTTTPLIPITSQVSPEITFASIKTNTISISNIEVQSLPTTTIPTMPDPLTEEQILSEITTKSITMYTTNTDEIAITETTIVTTASTEELIVITTTKITTESKNIEFSISKTTSILALSTTINSVGTILTTTTVIPITFQVSPELTLTSMKTNTKSIINIVELTTTTSTMTEESIKTTRTTTSITMVTTNTDEIAITETTTVTTDELIINPTTTSRESNMITIISNTQLATDSSLYTSSALQTTTSSTLYKTTMNLNTEAQLQSENVYYIITAVVVVVTALLVLFVYAFIFYKRKKFKSKVVPMESPEKLQIKESTV